MGGPRYKPSDRVIAVEVANQIGEREASRLLDIPRTSIQDWRHQAIAAVTFYDDNEDDPLGLSFDLSWEERQERAAMAWERTATAARRIADECLLAGKVRDAQYATTAAAIATDKARLLSGAATSRSESRSVRVEIAGERLAELMSRLPPSPSSRPPAIEAKSSEGASKGFVIPGETTSDQPKRRRGTGGRPRTGPKNVSGD